MQSRFAFLPHRSILALKGPDTLALLERLITCNTKDWSEGEARYGALLAPQGKILADFLAIRVEDGVLLDVHGDALPDLAKRLKLFRLRASVEIEPLERQIIVTSMEPAEHGLRPVSGAYRVYIDPRYEGGRLRAIAHEAEWRQYHGHEAEWSVPVSEYHADRIASCVPEFGEDFETASVFPADVNMDRLGGVDYKKGCFVGQEVVSRMYRRGGVRKRTVLLEKAGCAPGDPVAPAEGASIGKVTSATEHQALAVLRLDRLAKLDTRLDMIGPEWAFEEMNSVAAND
ncbi:MAG: folate-binding protein [Pseudomonadota bacterium]